MYKQIPALNIALRFAAGKYLQEKFAIAAAQCRGHPAIRAEPASSDTFFWVEFFKPMILNLDT